jgi:serine O-acetyltransferase
VDEVILCYPGVDAVFVHRTAHLLHGMGVPLVPRMMSELAHGRTGIDIHPAARIGSAFFIDHGTGVVIGETAEIGDHVKIYQGVTIGAKSIERDADGRVVRGRKRHPTIGSRVTIYADSVILGGDTVVGDDCVVSGAVFLTQSAPAGHIVRAKQPELVLRTNRAASRGE